MSHRRRMTAVLLLALLSAPSPAGPPALAGLEKLWADLGSREPATAERVMVRLAAQPTQTIPFLCDHLHPVVIPSSSRVARWLAELDSDDFSTRELAMHALEKASELVEEP